MKISSESVLGGVFTNAKRSHESDVLCVTLNHQVLKEAFIAGCNIRVL
jgi:hypothetical protein